MAYVPRAISSVVSGDTSAPASKSPPPSNIAITGYAATVLSGFSAKYVSELAQPVHFAIAAMAADYFGTQDVLGAHPLLVAPGEKAAIHRAISTKKNNIHSRFREAFSTPTSATYLMPLRPDLQLSGTNANEGDAAAEGGSPLKKRRTLPKKAISDVDGMHAWLEEAQQRGLNKVPETKADLKLSDAETILVSTVWGNASAPAVKMLHVHHPDLLLRLQIADFFAYKVAYFTGYGICENTLSKTFNKVLDIFLAGDGPVAAESDQDLPPAAAAGREERDTTHESSPGRAPVPQVLTTVTAAQVETPQSSPSPGLSTTVAPSGAAPARGKSLTALLASSSEGIRSHTHSRVFPESDSDGESEYVPPAGTGMNKVALVASPPKGPAQINPAGSAPRTPVVASPASAVVVSRNSDGTPKPLRLEDKKAGKKRPTRGARVQRLGVTPQVSSS